jgi:hypothetical protein
VNRAIPSIFVAVTLLAGCKQTPPGPSTAILSSTNVAIHGYRFYSAASGNTSSGERESFYAVCAITFTNTLGFDVAPEPKNFVLTDPVGNQYVGVDTGATALVGISNFRGIVKKDERQDYTIAFHVPANVSGTIFYAP